MLHAVTVFVFVRAVRHDRFPSRIIIHRLRDRTDQQAAAEHEVLMIRRRIRIIREIEEQRTHHGIIFAPDAAGQ